MILGFALGCQDAERHCGDCGKDEYCVEYGSDVAGEPNRFECAELPNDCQDDASCGCLATVEDGDSNIEFSLTFCLKEGSCGVTENVPHVVCPGG